MTARMNPTKGINAHQKNKEGSPLRKKIIQMLIPT